MSANVGFEDCYAILEVSESATAAEIKTNYKRLALLYHPDKDRSSGATERFQRVQQAYATLGDTHARNDYDFRRAQRTKVIIPNDAPSQAPQYPGTFADARDKALFDIRFAETQIKSCLERRYAADVRVNEINEKITWLSHQLESLGTGDVARDNANSRLRGQVRPSLSKQDEDAIGAGREHRDRDRCNKASELAQLEQDLDMAIIDKGILDQEYFFILDYRDKMRQKYYDALGTRANEMRSEAGQSTHGWE